MFNLVKIATTPLVRTGPHTSVIDAVRIMDWHRTTVMLVIEDDKLLGIFSEQDLLRRVVVKGLSLYNTPIAELMSSPVQTLHKSATMEAALKTMHKGNFRHIPIVNGSDEILGILSMSDLLSQQIRELGDENKTLVAYMSADGSGG